MKAHKVSLLNTVKADAHHQYINGKDISSNIVPVIVKKMKVQQDKHNKSDNDICAHCLYWDLVYFFATCTPITLLTNQEIVE